MQDLGVSFPEPCDERWEAMTPTGRHRACAKCDRVVYDLARYNVAGVEKLLRDEPNSCARATIDALGVIATKPERYGNIRRIVVAIGASAGLLISPPAVARDSSADGSIIGTAIRTYGSKVK
jgi:hypothetical protein